MRIEPVSLSLVSPVSANRLLGRVARFEPVRPADPIRPPAPDQRPPAVGEDRTSEPPWSEVEDVVELSPAARRAAARAVESNADAQCPDSSRPADRQPAGGELTEQDQARVEELKQRDQRVRQHERAHLAAAGPYAHGAQYEYETGLDGNRYATGGEVQIDTSPIPNDPQATIAKMRIVQAAALAPADPSPQDRAVAAKAAAAIQRAQAELARKPSEPAGAPAAAPHPQRPFVVAASPAMTGSPYSGTSPIGVLDAPTNATRSAYRAASVSPADPHFQSATAELIDTHA